MLGLCLLITSGCSKKDIIYHNYTYKGENELWTAEYKVKGKGTFTEVKGKTEYESEAENVLTVIFKKDIAELASVKHLNISYKSSASGGEINHYFNEDSPVEKVYSTKHSSEGSAIESKDEIIKVSIQMDDEIQTLELMNLE